MLTKDELAAIRERAEKAAPGPWDTDSHAPDWITAKDPYGHGWFHVAETRGWGHLTERGACGFDEQKACEIQNATTAFIAASRDAIPALVAEVRRLTHELETARTANTTYIADADLYRQAEVARYERADALEQVARLTAQRDRARAVADGLVEVYKCPLQQKVKEAFKAYDAERDSR